MKDTLAGLKLRWIKYLCKRFHQIRAMDISPSAEHLDRILEIYYEIIPLINENAKKVSIRNKLYEVLSLMNSKKSITELSDKIALYELELGLYSNVFKLPCSENIISIAEKHKKLYISRYGCDESVSHPKTRGEALSYYFLNNLDFITEKKILHIAPEKELRIVMESLSPELKISYETADPYMKNVEHFVDMAKILCADEQYDLIICHRVLEHVYDDIRAISEAYRILKKGGCLNISVPIAFEKDKTIEWYIPDPSTFGHVRQYGMDFPERLKDAGFNIQEERWLFNRSDQELADNRAFKMLIYNAWKP